MKSRQGIYQTHYREVTWSAVIFGALIGVVMNAALTYTGLKIGFTITGSAIAAVLGFGVLRGILRRRRRTFPLASCSSSARPCTQGKPSHGRAPSRPARRTNGPRRCVRSLLSVRSR